MKQCPGCGKNLADSAVTCPFCRRGVREGAPPVRPGDLPSLTGDIQGEPHTLNWLVLLMRCLSSSGRFSRSQFAVVYVGTLAMFWSLAIAFVLGLEAAGVSEDTASTVGGLLILAMVPVVMIAAIGGSIRRWHDLGHSGWMALLNLSRASARSPSCTCSSRPGSRIQVGQALAVGAPERHRVVGVGHAHGAGDGGMSSPASPSG